MLGKCEVHEAHVTERGFAGERILTSNHGKLHWSAANTRRFKTVNMVE